jgi:hypothetical protein
LHPKYFNIASIPSTHILSVGSWASNTLLTYIVSSSKPINERLAYYPSNL